ncbi:hypothetical protein VOLCADRAFT_92023 [Volvox carteri f. nagariensis]|uniref:Sugar phosphate transporter domain-containing protein n=1 Tax=Volvox carteri f. nagariensis TaxID=3068 RepID=D8TYW7_VOLCA|nr:uncharacterized protein VOLCADRAFT_92023 [Volvox carteri f. nagariensis]EFJ47385.1 hypothetical protein VOLCADRAFT_92023 [Volvox carteri f. nagariensis]|eukprot:XP_002951574.1 hypothetical protein VOLCADRAFT_92023 [Volvox carteri f. nagariensis]
MYEAFTPAITLALCVAAGLERASPPLLVAISMIVGGTAGAVLVESGAPSFRLVGFAAFMTSSLTEAARVVGAELLRDGAKYNTAESLVYIGGPTAALLLVIAAVVEWPQAAAAAAYGRGFALAARDPMTFITAPLVSALVNMSCFFAINATSSLTFKVAGCVKNVAVVAYGVVAHGEAITVLQVAGYAVSVVGFTIYSQLKLAPTTKRTTATVNGNGNRKQTATPPRVAAASPPPPTAAASGSGGHQHPHPHQHRRTKKAA